MAIEHFDEGVYASNLWFGPDSEYPQRALYAPPMFPFLVGITISLFGTGAAGCMAISLATGLATVGGIWWMARSWFGVGAGVFVLSLAALSDFHIQFSRMCLTDATLCCALIAAVYMFSRVSTGHTVSSAGIAGAAAALAWWTKYTGWLPLAICGSASVACGVFHSKSAVSRKQLSIGWLVMVGVCAVLCVPLFQGLEDIGGYSAITSNHSGYVTGLSGWLAACRQHHAIQLHYDDWPTLGGLLLAIVLGQWMTWPQDAWNQASRGSRLRMALGLLGLAALAGLARLWIGTTATLFAICLWGLATQLFDKQQHNAAASKLPAWLLLSWIGGLSLAVPMYQPFPRLALPWVIAVWLGAAAALKPRDATTAENSPKLPLHPKFLHPLVSAALSILFVISLYASMDSLGRLAAWQDQTHMAQTADRMQSQIKQHSSGMSSGQYIVYTYAEPAMFYQLAARSVSTLPINNLSFAHATRQPTHAVFLITGPHADRSPTFAAEWAQVAQRFELLHESPCAPTDLVRLNSESPQSNGTLGPHPDQRLRLFQLRKRSESDLPTR